MGFERSSLCNSRTAILFERSSLSNSRTAILFERFSLCSSRTAILYERSLLCNSKTAILFERSPLCRHTHTPTHDFKLRLPTACHVKPDKCTIGPHILKIRHCKRSGGVHIWLL